ncbi:fibrous sheath-interacting protein 2-like [Alligator mississippiensis]|uniref:fibrous sheath-interacting protein 2-like n=1 Tax=Alligator mississippiensis TaxID=8496 RepID=UPI0028772D0C|nr:fibrous sheath-interacting protein 2-like [Alligator mississippiensis]
MTDAVTNIMTWFMDEVTDILYPAIMEYEERKITERDMRDKEASAKKCVCTGRKITPGSSPGCGKKGSRGKLTSLFSQHSPGLSPGLGREVWEDNLPEPEPAAVPPRLANHLSRLRRESVCSAAQLEHPRQTFQAERFPRGQRYFQYNLTQKDGQLETHLIKEDISSDVAQDRPKTGMLRKLFSPINAQEQALGSGEQVQREGQMPRQVQVPELANPHSGGISKVCYHARALGLKPSPSPQDILNKPRTVRSSMTLPQLGKQLPRKPCLSSRRKIFPEEEAPLPRYSIKPQHWHSPAGICADAFFHKTYDDLMNKRVPSQNFLAQDSVILGSDPSRFSTELVDSVLSKLSGCQATARQPLEDQSLFPDIDTLTAQIIHSSLSDLRHESAPKITAVENRKSNRSVSAEGLSVLQRREITDHQRLAKASPPAQYKPLDPGKMDEKLFEDATKSTSQCQSPTPSTPEVWLRYLKDIISRLFSDILPAAPSTSSMKEKKTELAGFDLLPLKVIRQVMAKISEDDDSCSQHTDHLHAKEDAMIQTTADSVYNKLLSQFHSQVSMQNCLRNGCLVLSEALCDLVFQEVSGSPLQSSLSGESSLSHRAEADNFVGNTPRDVSEPLENSNTVPSDLSKIVPLIIKKQAGNLSMFSSLFPIAEMDAEKTSLLKDATAGRSSQHQRHLSRAEVSTLAENLNQAVEEGLSRHQISLVPATGEEPPRCPEQEGALIPGDRKYYLIIPQQSGSEQDLYKDVTGFDAHLPQDVVTVIIEEISNRPLLQVASDRLSQSTTDPDRLADKALSHESISAESKSWRDEEAVPGTSADKTPTGTEELATLRALLPKVDLLAQLAAHYTEDEEGEERVEDDLESEQQWKEEEELQQIKETTPVKSSVHLWSPLGSFTDTEPSSVAVGGLSGSLEAQTSLEWMSVDTWLAWDREDSLDTAVFKTPSEDAGPAVPDDMGVNTGMHGEATLPKLGDALKVTQEVCSEARE